MVDLTNSHLSSLPANLYLCKVAKSCKYRSDFMKKFGSSSLLRSIADLDVIINGTLHLDDTRFRPIFTAQSMVFKLISRGSAVETRTVIVVGQRYSTFLRLTSRNCSPLARLWAMLTSQEEGTPFSSWTTSRELWIPRKEERMLRKETN